MFSAIKRTAKGMRDAAGLEMITNDVILPIFLSRITSTDSQRKGGKSGKLLVDRENAVVNCVVAVKGEEVTGLWAELNWFAARASGLVIKANVRPSLAAEFANAVADSHSYVLLQAQALNGIVYATYPDVGDSVEQAASIVNPLLNRAIEGGGNLTVRHCPTAWKKSLRVWGRPGSDRDLMRHVKRTLDPRNVFNPGRLFGDL